MIIAGSKELLETIELFVLDKNTLYHINLYK